ncbi:proline/glycine betaine ABC transporter permease [Paenisporosarcina sp. TG20]|uniref:ABC transporter permease n=1 Tax=Paenisporosarcina sp. TG20 TaxID=1211706 RepID=UPI0002D5ADF4|nr:proline/glycine betaine ABC transporter permease [Paenisporosarcina sp. TG20]
MNNFPNITLEIGIYAEMLIDWLMDNFEIGFDAISFILLQILLGIESFLLWLPWWVIVGIVFALGWRLINLKTGIFFGAMIFLVGTFGGEGLYWGLMMSTLALILVAVLVSLTIGIPLGIWMAYNQRIQSIVTPILDGMQTMPSFVYLIPAMVFFGLGLVPAVFATIIYAVPPVIRLTNLAIREVSQEMIEAGQSFGSTPWQILRKIQLPQALPTIMTGVNQTTMMALAMVVIASMVGARGLGMEVLTALGRLDTARGFEAGISIVILAVIIDRLSQAATNRFKAKE